MGNVRRNLSWPPLNIDAIALEEKRTVCMIICGPGSSVGIATGYGLDGPGIESRSRFSASVQTGPGAHTQPPVQWVPGLSWW